MITIIMACYGNLDKSVMSYESILKNTDVPFKLIVVEQNSPDKSREWASSLNDDRVHVHLPEKNKGLVYARNYGLENIHPDSKYIMFFDNDIYAPKNWASRMVDFMERHQNVGASGPASNFAGNPQLVEFNKKINFTDEDAIHRIEERSIAIKTKKPEFQYAPKNWPVVGFALFIREKAAKQIGFFDNNITGEWDDTDYCRSIEKQGWKLAYINNIYIHHWGHSSKGVQGSQYTHKNQEESKEYIKKKWGWI